MHTSKQILWLRPLGHFKFLITDKRSFTLPQLLLTILAPSSHHGTSEERDLSLRKASGVGVFKPRSHEPSGATKEKYLPLLCHRRIVLLRGCLPIPACPGLLCAASRHGSARGRLGTSSEEPICWQPHDETPRQAEIHTYQQSSCNQLRGHH